MAKAFIGGSITDLDELEKQLSDLGEAESVERGKKPSPLSPEGHADIWDRWNKRGKYAEKRKPNDKTN